MAWCGIYVGCNIVLIVVYIDIVCNIGFMAIVAYGLVWH